MPVFKGKSLGAFGALGGTLTTGIQRVEITPDPYKVAFGLMRVADYLDDTDAPMRAAKAIAVADMKEHFDTDTAPDGNAWAPLDPDYAKSKASAGYDSDNILTRSSRLERRATSPNAWVVKSGVLFFRTGNLPRFWPYHQYGSDPEGLNVGYAAKHRAAPKDARRDPATERVIGKRANLGIGSGKALPERPFIGLSGEAEIQILEVFDLWFRAGSSASLVITQAGTVQERVGGRFGSKLFPAF